jgi:uncharacterized protein (DUF433 family)
VQPKLRMESILADRCVGACCRGVRINRSEVVTLVAKGKYQKWLTKDGLTILEAWARDGLTDEQIAHNMGITKSTLYAWKAKYPEFSDALKKGKEVVDIEVENALLKRAIGFEYTETRIEETEREKKIITTKKFMPPETAAAFIWLKNRKPKQWRDKQPENQNVIDTEDDPITASLKEHLNK